jgi:hypothetical protein
VTASTLPLMAVALESDGCAWFPFTTGTDAESVTLFLRTPQLPVPTWRWVTLPDDDPRPHIPLDLVHLARLEFLAAVPPEAIDDLGAVLAEQLAGCRCNPAALLATVAAEYGQWPTEAASHMSACLLDVARRTGMEL